MTGIDSIFKILLGIIRWPKEKHFYWLIIVLEFPTSGIYWSHKAKVDNELKQLRYEMDEMKEAAQNMYNMEMKSCIDLVQVS